MTEEVEHLCPDMIFADTSKASTRLCLPDNIPILESVSLITMTMTMKTTDDDEINFATYKNINLLYLIYYNNKSFIMNQDDII